MTATFEILGKFDTEANCHKVLYAPVEHPWTFRETQVYQIDYDGDTDALRAFVSQVLLDPISQELKNGDEKAFPEAAFVLEYGMKGGALDLEKETILNYYRSIPEKTFDLQKLTLRKRVHVFGEGADSEPFVRDICNPAIHTWEVN